jgi:hypothetical protein
MPSMIRPIEEGYFPRQRSVKRERNFKDWLGRPVYHGEDEATSPLLPRPMTSLEDMLLLQDPTYPRHGFTSRRHVPMESAEPREITDQRQYVFDFMVFGKKSSNHFG